MRWNIFDRAGIYARIAQADAAAAANVARYQTTVTQALEEVDSAVSGYGNERERQAQLVAAVAASRDAAELAELRFFEGAEDFLTVLDAGRSLLQLEDQQALSAVNVAQRLVDSSRARRRLASRGAAGAPDPRSRQIAGIPPMPRDHVSPGAGGLYAPRSRPRVAMAVAHRLPSSRGLQPCSSFSFPSFATP
ncbi:MAG: TolC family protein [Proteobacteria bacterium]|nr:TolC family protein [Pseudomonadota bacterium]